MPYSAELKKHTKSRPISLLGLLCAVVYMVSYLSRLSFSAVMVEMIVTEGFDKALIAIPLTALSVTYGLGQIIFGWLGDKVKPENLIFTGLLVSAAMNFLIPFISFSIVLMTAAWCVNGFAQAMMWPPMVKILTACLDEWEFRKTVVYVGWGSSVGTIIIYLFAPVSIALINWKAVFFFAAGFAVIFAAVWRGFIYRAEVAAKGGREIADKASVKVEAKPFDRFAALLLIFIILSVTMQGILRDGIANWMPTYITEVFKVESTISILTGIALPIFSMFIMWFSAFVYRKWIKNESLCAAMFFLVCALSIGMLSIFSATGAVLSVSMLMVANAATHGVNLMYTSMVVPRFSRYGKTSFVTGLINSATYVGSAISTLGVAYISEIFGWSGTIISWLIVSVLGIALTLVSVKYLNRLKKL